MEHDGYEANLDSIRQVLESDEPKSERVWVTRWTGSYGGSDQVVKLKDRYYYLEDEPEESSGPFGSLNEALESCEELTFTTNATEEVECGELSSREIAAALRLVDADPGHVVLINRERWVLAPSGNFEPKA